MFNSNIIDVAIGLVFMYLTLSLICSAANEGIETFLKQRSKNLEKGIRELLGDLQPEGTTAAKPADSAGQKSPPSGGADGTAAGNGRDEDFVALLYNHGLINGLYRGKYGETPLRKLPSYIPAANFALAVLDLRNNPNVPLPKNLRSVLTAFEIKAKGDLAILQRELEGWYDSAMDRVSGWYKRRVQVILASLAVVASIAVNADTVYIARRLSTDSNLRQSVARIAEETTRHPPQGTQAGPTGNAAPASGQGAGTNDASPGGQGNSSSSSQAIGNQPDPVDRIKTNLAALDGIGLPIGWNEFLAAEDEKWNAVLAKWKAEEAKRETEGRTKQDPPGRLSKWAERGLDAVKLHGIGWVVTALAVSLGAPFWFDMLNKIMVVRSTVKPSEKSGPEGSKDARRTPQPAPLVEVAEAGNVQAAAPDAGSGG